MAYDQDEEVIWDSYAEGPRWAAIGDALRQSAYSWKKAGVRITVTHESRGWLRTTTYFKVEGPRWGVEQFRDLFVAKLRSY